MATASVAAADVTFSGYGRFGVKYSGSVAGTDAVAGGHTTASVAADTTAGIYSAYNSTNAATIGLVDKYNGVTLADSASTGGFVAPTLSSGAAASTSAQLATMQLALANAAIARAAEVASQDAGSAAAITTIDSDVKKIEAAIAAASGTPAVAAIASDTLVTSRLRMNIDASTESDSGVTFGVRVRVQQDEGNTNAFNSARFYAKSGGLELGVGNIYGVIDNMAGLYSGSVGLTGLGWGNVVSNFGSLAYSSGGAGSAGTKEAAEVIYSMGDYGFAVATDGTDTEYGVSATVSGWTVALSASDTDTAANSEWVATVGGSIGGVKVGLATAEAVNGNSSTTLSAAFDVAAATSVTVYYNDDEANTIDDKSYGLGVVHGLGGGASLRGGIVSVNDRTLADFGVLFNF